MTETPKIKTVDQNEDLICPFCLENEFDLPVLKWHILYNCDKFLETESL